MHTEDEAKAKWCAFARVWAPPDEVERQAAGWNRMDCGSSAGDSDAYKAGCDMRVTNCIASACMSWRFGPSRYIPAPDGAMEVGMVPGGFKAVRANGTTVKQGYCGLAGKPSA